MSILYDFVIFDIFVLFISNTEKWPCSLKIFHVKLVVWEVLRLTDYCYKYTYTFFKNSPLSKIGTSTKIVITILLIIRLVQKCYKKF